MKRKRGELINKKTCEPANSDTSFLSNSRSRPSNSSRRIVNNTRVEEMSVWSPSTELGLKLEPQSEEEDLQPFVEVQQASWDEANSELVGECVKEENYQPESSENSNFLAEHFSLHVFKEEFDEIPENTLIHDTEDNLEQQFFSIHESTAEIFSTSPWPQHVLVDLPSEIGTSELHMEVLGEPSSSFQMSQDNPFAVEVAYKSLRDTDKHFKYYQCPQCKLYFNSSVQLHEHILGNTKNQKFKNHANSKLRCGFFCDICKKRFSVLKALKMHEIIHDSSLNVSPAHAVYSNDMEDLEGIEMETPEDNFTYGRKCKICFKWLASGDDMDKHLNSHYQFKPYQCKKCDEKFGLETEFKSHSKIHEIAKNARGFYVCLFCEKGIKGFGPLKIHMKNIHNENLHKLYHMKE